jgi:general secretion pathway protein K
VLIKNKNGVALILVLTIVMLLTTVIFSINYRVRKSLNLSIATKKQTSLYHMADSGIDLGIWMLLKDAKNSDPDSVDSVHDDWAKETIVNQYAKDLVFEQGNVKVYITDEMGKIKVNALIKQYPGSTVDEDQKKIWENVLDFLISSDKSEDISDSESIIDGMIDWLDQNDLSSANGAETDYYESKKNPYKAKNGPLKTVEELNLIKGMNQNLFNIENFINNLTAKGNDNNKDNDSVYKLDDFLTVAGNMENDSKQLSFDGKININTAKLPVILALLPKDGSKVDRYYYAKAMIDFRDEVDDTGAGKNSLKGSWYTKCSGCLGSGIEKSNMVTTVSNIYSIESKATIENFETTIKAIIERYLDKVSGKWKYKIISYRTY